MSENLEKMPVHFGSETLKQAQLKAGLTDFEVAAELGVGERTWARWKGKGDVLYQHVTAVVLLLDLPMPDNLPVEAPRTAWAILRAMEEVSRLVGELVAGLQRLEVPPAAPDPDQPRDD